MSMQFDGNDTQNIFADVNLEELESGMANGMSFNAKIDDSVAFDQKGDVDDTMIRKLEDDYSFEENGRAAGPVSGEIVPPDDDEAESFFKNMGDPKARQISVIKNDTKIFGEPANPEPVRSNPQPVKPKVEQQAH